MKVVAITTTRVPIPPATTEVMGPKILAVRPLSNPPSSLLAPTKMLLTAETRPRMESGVRTWTRVWRTRTETLSKTPVRKSMVIESQKYLERPKTMVAMPNPATAQRSDRPARFMGEMGHEDGAQRMRPRAGEARSQPNPRAPTFRMFCA